MKRSLILILLLSNTLHASQVSNGPDGINSTITGLDGSSPLTGNIVIGEADAGRSGKPGFDDFDHSATYTDPFVVLGTAPFEHATQVAGFMIGSLNALPGVAPAAHLYSKGFSDETDASSDCVDLQSLAKISGMKAINISWNLDNNSFEHNGLSLLAQFVDWSAVRHDVLYVVAAGNYKPEASDPNYDRSPADQYNGITVAASRLGIHDGTYSEFSDINRSPDARDPNYFDRSYIDIMAPGGNDPSAGIPVQGFGSNVTNVYGTSFATPHVTGTVALLWQYRDQQTVLNNARFDSVHHYGIKAVILNSADKLEGVHGSIKTVLNNHNLNYTETPAGMDPDIALDPGMGVGALNAGRAVTQFKSGIQYPGEPTPVPAVGWSEYFVGEGQSQEYILPQLGAGYIAITLCWDRYTEHTGGNIYNYGDTFFPYAADYGPMVTWMFTWKPRPVKSLIAQSPQLQT